jgi:hypothetical protein
MSLYVTINNVDDHRPFHLGVAMRDHHCVDRITAIQVDNTELEYIRDNIPGLPIPNKRVVKFYGDTAKMIVGNLFD